MKGTGLDLVRIGCKRVTAEQKAENSEEVLGLDRSDVGLKTLHVGECRDIDLQEILGPRTRPLPVEPPMTSIGQDAPANLVLRQNFDSTQIVQNLSRGRASAKGIASILTIERPLPPL